jgi:hypothetical protein
MPQKAGQPAWREELRRLRTQTRAEARTLLAGSVVLAFIAAGCGSATRPQRPAPSERPLNGPAYQAATADIAQWASHPDWSTDGIDSAFSTDTARMPRLRREVDAALLLAYVGELEQAHQMPVTARGQLTAAFTGEVPGLAAFLPGTGTRYQAMYLRSPAFRLTIGRQLGCLGVQALAAKYGGSAQGCPAP